MKKLSFGFVASVVFLATMFVGTEAADDKRPPNRLLITAGGVDASKEIFSKRPIVAIEHSTETGNVGQPLLILSRSVKRRHQIPRRRALKLQCRPDQGRQNFRSCENTASQIESLNTVQLFGDVRSSGYRGVFLIRPTKR